MLTNTKKYQPSMFDLQVMLLHFRMCDLALRIRQLPEVQELRQLAKEYKTANDWISKCEN